MCCTSNNKTGPCCCWNYFYMAFFFSFQDQICESSDILQEKGLNRVANTVAALVAIATHSKHPVPSNV